MKPVVAIFAVLVALVSHSARAESQKEPVHHWVFDQVDKDGSQIYIDYANIRRTPERSYVWALWDFDTPQGAPPDDFSSRVVEMNFDCLGAQGALVVDIYYSGSMGTSRIAVRGPAVENVTFLPGSWLSHARSVACGRPGITHRPSATPRRVQADPRRQAVEECVRRIGATINTRPADVYRYCMVVTPP